jgi:hypothetical protein
MGRPVVDWSVLMSLVLPLQLPSPLMKGRVPLLQLGGTPLFLLTFHF